jgi:isoquinoline 1-oxidoreductase beta subunit
VDGIGHALLGDFGFDNGKPKFDNFNAYRLIRNSESPKVEVHFVDSDVHPTGLGAALTNAIYAGLGKRLYSQPFSKKGISLV